MELFGDILAWLTDPENWSGDSGIPNRTWEHVRYSLSSTVIAVLLAVPLGMWLGHRRRYGTVTITVANLGRTLPSIAVLALTQQLFGLDELGFAGPTTAVIALVLVALPSILINAYVGMAEVPDEIRDAARGMGFRGTRQAIRVELPVALPLMLAGIRTAAVYVVATATLAALMGAGGLGRYIIDGLAVRDFGQLGGGALLVAALAIVTELSFAGLTRLTVSPGLRRGRHPYDDTAAANVADTSL